MFWDTVVVVNILTIDYFLQLMRILFYGLVVRIPAFHVGSSGSIPDVRTTFSTVSAVTRNAYIIIIIIIITHADGIVA